MSEQEFWESAYIAYMMATGGTKEAANAADRAVEDYNRRLTEVNDRHFGMNPEPRG